MATTRHATAHWSGDLKTGGGTISTPQSVLMAEAAYGFNTRFGDGNPNARRGTNPEELIASPNAACFPIALSNTLAAAGHATDAVGTSAYVDLSLDCCPTLPVICLHKKVRGPRLAD